MLIIECYHFAHQVFSGDTILQLNLAAVLIILDVF